MCKKMDVMLEKMGWLYGVLQRLFHTLGGARSVSDSAAEANLHKHCLAHTNFNCYLPFPQRFKLKKRVVE